MNTEFLETQLVAYLSLREALGFQMRAEKILLPEFVAFVKAQEHTGPIRAQLALEWACQTSGSRGPERRRSAPQYGTGVSQLPPGLRARYRRARPRSVAEPTAAQTLSLYANAADGPLGGGASESSAWIVTPPHLIHLIGLLASTGLRVGEAIRLQVDACPAGA